MRAYLSAPITFARPTSVIRRCPPPLIAVTKAKNISPMQHVRNVWSGGRRDAGGSAPPQRSLLKVPIPNEGSILETPVENQTYLGIDLRSADL